MEPIRASIYVKDPELVEYIRSIPSHQRSKHIRKLITEDMERNIGISIEDAGGAPTGGAAGNETGTSELQQQGAGESTPTPGSEPARDFQEAPVKGAADSTERSRSITEFIKVVDPDQKIRLEITGKPSRPPGRSSAPAKTSKKSAGQPSGTGSTAATGKRSLLRGLLATKRPSGGP